MYAVRRHDVLHAQPILHIGERLGGDRKARKDRLSLCRPEAERDVLARDGRAAEGLARSSDGADAPQLEEAELFAHQAPGIDVPHVLFEHQKVRADAAVRAVAFAVNVVDGKLLRLGNGAVDEGELVRYLLDGDDGSLVESLDEEEIKEINANAKSYTVRNEEGKTVSYDDVDWSPWISVETKARLRRGLPVVSGTDDGGVMCIGMDGVKWMYKICNTEVNDPVQVSETDYIVTDADGNVRRLSVKM